MHTNIEVYVGDEFAYGYKVPNGDSLLTFLSGSPEFVEVDKSLRIPLKGDKYNKETGFTYLDETERSFNEVVVDSTVIAFIENGIVDRSVIYIHGIGLNDTIIPALLSDPTFIFKE